MIRVTRRYRFSASHRLHSDSLSEAENQDLYGKCNNPHGHGHDYVLEVMVAGPVDKNTGLAVSVTALDGLVNASILRDFDQHDLNSEIPEFRELVPTSENVARVIERRLNENWNTHFAADGPRLYNIRLHETKRNRFELK